MTLFEFTTKGRLGRADLLYGVLVPLTVLALVAYGIDAVTQTLVPFATLVVSVVALILAIPPLVRRLHDRGRSAWFFLVLLIPFVGALWFIVETYFRKGDGTENRYGPVPESAAGDDGKTVAAVVVVLVIGLAGSWVLSGMWSIGKQLPAMAATSYENFNAHEVTKVGSRFEAPADVDAVLTEIVADGKLSPAEKARFWEACTASSMTEAQCKTAVAALDRKLQPVADAEVSEPVSVEALLAQIVADGKLSAAEENLFWDACIAADQPEAVCHSELNDLRDYFDR